jgi:hypothetical protein
LSAPVSARQRGSVSTDELTIVLAYAALAPSVHNTQPWCFSAVGDAVEVRADRSRQLPYLDPTGRQLHVSCGAAIEFGYLAARAVGRRCDVAVLPDPAEPDLLARLTLGPAEPATPAEQTLAEAIATRYTDRGPYADAPVPPEVTADIAARAVELGTWIYRLDRAGDRVTLAGVLSMAEQAEAADAQYAAELTAWTARADRRGMPVEAVADNWPGDRVSDVQLRDFTGRDEHPRPGSSDDGAPTVERDLLVMFGTAYDDPPSWLAAGRTLGWALLRASAAGVSAQPLGQAIDLPKGRERLRRELGFVGYPQFVVRMGYGAGRPRTRREITDPVLR